MNHGSRGLVSAVASKQQRGRRVYYNVSQQRLFRDQRRSIVGPDPYCPDPPRRSAIPFVYGAGVGCSRRFIMRIMNGATHLSSFLSFFLSFFLWQADTPHTPFVETLGSARGGASKRRYCLVNLRFTSGWPPSKYHIPLRRS